MPGWILTTYVLFAEHNFTSIQESAMNTCDSLPSSCVHTNQTPIVVPSVLRAILRVMQAQV